MCHYCAISKVTSRNTFATRLIRSMVQYILFQQPLPLVLIHCRPRIDQLLKKQIRKRMEHRDRQKPGSGGQGISAPPARPTLPIVDESVISEKTPYTDYMRSPYNNTKSPPPVYHTPYSEYTTPSPYQQYDDQYYHADGGYQNQYGSDNRGNEHQRYNEEMYYDERNYYYQNQADQHSVGEAYAMTTYHQSPNIPPSSTPVVYNEVPAPQAYSVDNHLHYESTNVSARSLADSSATSPRQQHSGAATPSVPSARLPRAPGNYF
jgi:hypothetical protein